MLKALIVEDSKQISEVWKMILLREGYNEIIQLYDGAEVVTTVQEFKPDIVFMDVNLPGDLDGPELTALIRSIDASIPVLVLTLNNDLQIFLRAFECGAKGYIVKNSTITEIKDGLHAVSQGERYICSSMQKYAGQLP